MVLTQSEAIKNVGKYIDAKVRRFGYYPMQIITINGEAYLKDAVGVCMEVPEKVGFNSQWYDYITGGAEDG